MKLWHIIKSKPGKERQVETLLTQGSFEVFYPRLKELVYRAHSSSFVLKPLFPSYLFLRADLMESRNFHLIKYTRGVSHVLCAGNAPLSVGPEVVAAIRARADLNGVVEVHKKFKPGQVVRVKKGMLKDLIGILEKSSSDDERVRVLLKLANYQMSATLHISELEAVKNL